MTPRSPLPAPRSLIATGAGLRLAVAAAAAALLWAAVLWALG